MPRGTLFLEQRQRRLDALFKKIDSIPAEDLELRAHFARYLCVLVSGFLDTSIVDMILHYVAGVSHARVSRLTEVRLRRESNLNREALLQLIGGLDQGWKRELEEFLDGHRGSALDSLRGLRNAIAHGGDASVTYVTVQQYYVSVKEVVKFVADLLSPGP